MKAVGDMEGTRGGMGHDVVLRGVSGWRLHSFPIMPRTHAADMPFIRSALDVRAAWDTRFADTPVALLYKHSPTCGLSAMALDEVTAFLGAHPDVPVYQVDVLSSRSLSNEIESSLGIRHESPQAIVFRDGVAVWHGSHRGVNRARLTEAVAAAQVAG